MFLRYNKLEQLEFKLEKIIGIQKHAGKVRKGFVNVGGKKLKSNLLVWTANHDFEK